MTTAEDQYARPHEVDQLTLAFPANLGALLPATDAIPPDYRNRRQWESFARKWFAGTLPEGVHMHATEGIDARAAGRHLTAVLRSYEPKHEHKIAGVAWLASRWFDKVTLPIDSP